MEYATEAAEGALEAAIEMRISDGLVPLPSKARKGAIVEFTREHGRITMSEAIRLTSASRNTLKMHFRALVECGHLLQHGSGRGVWYELG